MRGLTVLVIDDEQPALEELAWLLNRHTHIGSVLTVGSATEALRLLQDTEVDAVFLDVQMPGLTGVELAQVLIRFRTPPPIVFVTAYEQHAVDAFNVRAIDYVLKPVREERLAESVRRVMEYLGTSTEYDDEQIPVERGGITRFINRSDITYVEAEGDYARLHTEHGSHLVRSPLTLLEEQWASAGFVRIHRSLLVALGYITEVRMDAGRCTVRVGREGQHVDLNVSRRHTPALRELLGQVRP